MTSAKEKKPAKKFFVHGKVVDPNNGPLLGATIEPLARTDASGSTCYGCREGFPNAVISGSGGEFIVERDEPFSRVQLQVIAPGFAPEKIWLPNSNTVQTVQLGVGATLTGSVTKDGKPLANVSVAVSGSDRDSEVYAGHFETKTDERGRFKFERLPPNTSWQFYGIIDSFKEHGCLPPRRVSSGLHGSTDDIGSFEVKPGLTLAGEVKDINGKPVPKLPLYAGNESTMHSATATTDEEGKFRFTGLYGGDVELAINSSEWSLTPLNRSLDDLNPWRMAGLLDKDKTDLLLIAEKKPRNYNGNYWNGNGHLASQDEARNRALLGAEPGGPPWLTFAGKIVDEETGQPIRVAKIILGRKPPVAARAPKPLAARILDPFRQRATPWNERIFWDFIRAQTVTNGEFRIQAMPLSASTPVLRIEAEGYEELQTDPISGSTTNLVLKLSRGSGPKGIILQPDGKPAMGAFVILAEEGQQFSLDPKNELTTYGNTNVLRKVGADGRFSFPARKAGKRIFASHKAGWANVALDDLPGAGEVKLEPWADVVGKLVAVNGTPATNMDLALTMWRGSIGSDPFVNIQTHAKTDAKGLFRFANVPPGELHLQRMVPVSGGRGSSYLFQTPLYALPGKTNDIGKVTLDTPPPPGFLEQLKKKLGL